jgi:(E)-4-hydroxy-3-methylbut-2-enyl-diphosphate synthase
MDGVFARRASRAFKIGCVGIGGEYPISIQSMTNTDTHDKVATYNQTRLLSEAGCDIVRIALPDEDSAKTVSYIKEKGLTTPLVADIHFDYKIALAALDAGVDKIRINPGNIGSREKTEKVVRACLDKRVPIRIGVNSGSLERSILEKHGGVCAAALVESALSHLKILHELGFFDVAISVKASNVPMMIEANRLLAVATDCPIHLGVTEAGARSRAITKSSIGIGTLLAEGIGDTVRVSLTDDPTEEIEVARAILSALELNKTRGMDIVSCPTCGRTRISLIGMLSDFENKARDEGLLDMDIKVALMGCAVNGPGEAREADIGIAGGIGEGLLFKKGEPIRKIKEECLVDELIREIKIMRDIKK